MIPAKFRSKVLEIIHESHAGAVRMKQLAKSYVWWPELDKDIEGLVNKCSNCLQNRNEPPKLKEAEWPIPPTPWTRLHMDFAGPVERPMLLIIADSTSKWLEIFPMATTTSAATIHVLRGVFARF